MINKYVNGSAVHRRWIYGYNCQFEWDQLLYVLGLKRSVYMSFIKKSVVIIKLMLFWDHWLHDLCFQKEKDIHCRKGVNIGCPQCNYFVQVSWNEQQCLFDFRFEKRIPRIRKGIGVTRRCSSVRSTKNLNNHFKSRLILRM